MTFPKNYNLSQETKYKYSRPLKTFENTFYLISTIIILCESAFFWRTSRKIVFSENLSPKTLVSLQIFAEFCDHKRTHTMSN